MNIDPETMKRIEAARQEGRVTETVAKRFLDPASEAIEEKLDERQFQADVIKLAKRNGWLEWHCFDSRRSRPGLPDLILIREKVIWAELKTEKGHLTAEQKEFIAALRNAGQQVYVWKPSMWPMIEEALR